MISSPSTKRKFVPVGWKQSRSAWTAMAITCATILLTPGSAWSWGGFAHNLTARMAESCLSPIALADETGLGVRPVTLRDRSQRSWSKRAAIPSRTRIGWPARHASWQQSEDFGMRYSGGSLVGSSCPGPRWTATQPSACNLVDAFLTGLQGAKEGY